MSRTIGVLLGNWRNPGHEHVGEKMAGVARQNCGRARNWIEVASDSLASWRMTRPSIVRGDGDSRYDLAIDRSGIRVDCELWA
jgi:hypothetical protein